MKERLRKILEKLAITVNANLYGFVKEIDMPINAPLAENLARVLIDAGVILPKFKVGGIVWYVDAFGGSITYGKIKCVRIDGDGIGYELDSAPIIYYEKEVFASEAEARAALEEKR